MATYTRANPLNIAAGGDTVASGSVKIDLDIADLFEAANANAEDIDALQTVTAGCDAIDIAEGTSADMLATPLALAALRGHGECRLVKSGSDLLLQRVGLGRMLVNSVMIQIPVAGLSLSTSGLSADTLYYVYLAISGDEHTPALAASATAPAVDATTGIMVMTGDATKTLVGMARAIAGPAWADSTRQRLVASYFNRRPVAFEAAMPSDTATSSTSLVDLLPSLSYRPEILAWEDMTTWVSVQAHAKIDLATTSFTVVANTTGGTTFQTVVSNFNGPSNFRAFVSGGGGASLSTGYHIVNIRGLTNGGTVTFYDTYTKVNGITWI